MPTPPTFSVGQYNTASYMNSIGLWLVKSQAITGTPSTVTVTGAFSADYDNYLVTYTGGALSATALVYAFMGSTSPGSTYYGGRTSVNVLGAAAFVGDNNTGAWLYAGVGNTSWCNMSLNIYTPFLADETKIFSQYFERTNGLGTYVGYVENTTSYTSFTLVPSSAATFSGGTIRVYGYRN